MPRPGATRLTRALIDARALADRAHGPEQDLQIHGLGDEPVGAGASEGLFHGGLAEACNGHDSAAVVAAAKGADDIEAAIPVWRAIWRSARCGAWAARDSSMTQCRTRLPSRANASMEAGSRSTWRCRLPAGPGLPRNR